MSLVTPLGHTPPAHTHSSKSHTPLITHPHHTPWSHAPIPNCMLRYTAPAQVHAGIHTHPLPHCMLGYTHPVPLHVGIQTPCPIACWDTHLLPHCMLGYTSPLVNRMTDRCKNITFPQTSFAGGNKSTHFNMKRECEWYICGKWYNSICN